MMEFIAGVVITLVFVAIYMKREKNGKTKDVLSTDLPLPPKPGQGTPR